MSIVNLILINGNEITEHNRTFESSELLSVNDIDLASGHKRRFYKDNKKNLVFLGLNYLAFKQKLLIIVKGKFI